MDWILADVVKTHGTSGMEPIFPQPGGGLNGCLPGGAPAVLPQGSEPSTPAPSEVLPVPQPVPAGAGPGGCLAGRPAHGVDAAHGAHTGHPGECRSDLQRNGDSTMEPVATELTAGRSALQSRRHARVAGGTAAGPGLGLRQHGLTGVQ